MLHSRYQEYTRTRHPLHFRRQAQRPGTGDKITTPRHSCRTKPLQVENGYPGFQLANAGDLKITYTTNNVGDSRWVKRGNSIWTGLTICMIMYRGDEFFGVTAAVVSSVVLIYVEPVVVELFRATKVLMAMAPNAVLQLLEK